ncbi:hypothetical protein F4803DRAFT_531873 [Xylaria telfairii]|nr:hypothetical protein F4803DRAFT_531873 [Xylaria telfairii]
MSTLGLLPGPAGYIAGLSVLAAIATLVVGLRFWVTKVTRAGLHFDDWLTLITIITVHGLLGIIFVAFTSFGLGHTNEEIASAGLPLVIGLQKLSFAASLLYSFASFAVKIAVIGFYFRIFPTRATRWGCYALGATCSAWLLVALTVTFAACRPLGSSWDPTIHGHCIDVASFPIALGGLNVGVDAATVALPVYEVLKLRLPKRKKYTVASIFFIGGIATAASLARFVGLLYTLDPNAAIDTAQLSSLLSALGIIEVYVGLIGACIPTLGPIFDRFRGNRGTSTGNSHSHSHSMINSNLSKRQSNAYVKTLDRTTSRSRLRNEDDIEGSCERLEGASISSAPAETGYWADASSHAGANPSKVDDIPLRSIHLERDDTI